MHGTIPFDTARFLDIRSAPLNVSAIVKTRWSRILNCRGSLPCLNMLTLHGCVRCRNLFFRWNIFASKRGIYKLSFLREMMFINGPPENPRKPEGWQECLLRVDEMLDVWQQQSGPNIQESVLWLFAQCSVWMGGRCKIVQGVCYNFQEVFRTVLNPNGIWYIPTIEVIPSQPGRRKIFPELVPFPSVLRILKSTEEWDSSWNLMAFNQGQ